MHNKYQLLLLFHIIYIFIFTAAVQGLCSASNSTLAILPKVFWVQSSDLSQPDTSQEAATDSLEGLKQ